MGDFGVVKKDGLNRSFCEICSNYCLVLNVHHIDGNRKNNGEDNLIAICNKCHGFIHNGFGKKKKKLKGLNFYLVDVIYEFRRVWLSNKFDASYGHDKVEFEKWMWNCIWKKSVKGSCFVCKKKRGLVYFVPDYVKRFSSDFNELGVYLCVGCQRSQQQVYKH